MERHLPEHRDRLEDGDGQRGTPLIQVIPEEQ